MFTVSPQQQRPNGARGAATCAHDRLAPASVVWLVPDSPYCLVGWMGCKAGWFWLDGSDCMLVTSECQVTSFLTTLLTSKCLWARCNLCSYYVHRMSHKICIKLQRKDEVRQEIFVQPRLFGESLNGSCPFRADVNFIRHHDINATSYPRN